MEWGATGAAQAADRGDAVVVVDVLSFSTTVTLCAARGSAVLPGSGDAPPPSALGATVADPRRDAPGRVTLSPASVVHLPPGEALVLPSRNGARMVGVAAGAPLVLIGCLRNRRAVAALVASTLADPGAPTGVTVVASGEDWRSVAPGTTGLRPCLEDWLGAGAIAEALRWQGLELSPEAHAAAETFAAAERGPLADWLRGCVSGRELVARATPDDIAIAGALDADPVVARLDADGWLRPA